MTAQEIGNVIQVVAVLAAVGASIVALVISAKDRKSAKEIAGAGRASSLRQAKLMFELDALVRLLQNRTTGGSTDKVESARLGAEALALVGLVGKDRVPLQWAWHIDATEEQLSELLTDHEFPQYKKFEVETQIALNAVLDDLRAEMERD